MNLYTFNKLKPGDRIRLREGMDHRDCSTIQVVKKRWGNSKLWIVTSDSETRNPKLTHISNVECKIEES